MPIALMQQFADMMRLGNEGIPERRKLLEEHERKLIEQAQTIHQTLDILRGKLITTVLGKRIPGGRPERTRGRRLFTSVMSIRIQNKEILCKLRQLGYQFVHTGLQLELHFLLI